MGESTRKTSCLTWGVRMTVLEREGIAVVTRPPAAALNCPGSGTGSSSKVPRCVR